MTKKDISGTKRSVLTWTARAIGPMAVLLVAAGAAGVMDPLGIVSVGSALAAVVALLVVRPRNMLGWSLITSAMVVFAVSGTLRVLLAVVGNLSHERDLTSDFATFPGYVLMGAGVLALGRKHITLSKALLDAVMGSLSALVLSWLVLGQQMSTANIPASVQFVLSAYVAASAALLVLVLHYAWGMGLRRTSPSVRALLASMACLLAGDVAMMVAEIRPDVAPLHLAGLPYVISFLALVAAMLHPSADLVQAERPTNSGSVNMVVVSASLVMPIAVAATGAAGAGAQSRSVLTGLLIAVAVLTIVKLKWAIDTQSRTQAILEHAATHDSLTGLANRPAVLTRLGADIEEARLTGGSVSVLFLDMDRFKYVNDTLGHRAGDELIIAAAQRIKEAVGDSALVARFGGDEFVLVAPGSCELEALVLGARVREALSDPFLIQGTEVTIGATIGASSWSQGKTASNLLEAADTALYVAKEAGRGTCLSYDDTMRADCERRVKVETSLRKALERDELEVHFQPLVRPNGGVHGAEALLRWDSKEIGPVSPMEFIPVAEETGLIVPIGRWVLEVACAQAARWRQEFGSFQVSVNVSARQLADPSFVQDVSDALAAHDLPGSSLDLEITEGLLAGAGTFEVLTELRALGVSIAIDDFGTGYSSLSYLKKFPVTRVKVDQAFVRTMLEHESDLALVKAVVAMAEALGLETVAEGVETAEQEAALTTLGVTFLQGYHFSRPKDARAATERMQELTKGALEEDTVAQQAARARFVVEGLAARLGAPTPLRFQLA